MEWWNVTIVIAAGILTIFNLGDKIIAWVKELKKPQNDLEDRIERLEKQQEIEYKALFAEYERRFKTDLDRINEMEKSNRLTQKAILALLSHAIDGNNIDQMKKAEEELTTYIFNK